MTDDTNAATDFVSDESPHFSGEHPQQEFAAWEEVDKGRFMPRRVRGSAFTEDDVVEAARGAADLRAATIEQRRGPRCPQRSGSRRAP